MDETDALKTENDNLKITIGVLTEQLSALRAENAQLKKDVIEAAKPRVKITPSFIELNDGNIQKLADGLRGYFHRNAVRKRYVTVACQLITMHNKALSLRSNCGKHRDFRFRAFRINR
jgi:hypothetical protein